MMATVPQVTSVSGLRKFQADGFLFDRVYVRGEVVLRAHKIVRVRVYYVSGNSYLYHHTLFVSRIHTKILFSYMLRY